MIKICIDAGHYGEYNQSPCNEEYFESVMTWKLHLKLKKYLEGYGIKVITTRSDQTKDLALASRGKKANGCDLFISLHSNAVGSYADEAIDYPIVYVPVSGKVDDLGKKLAERVAAVMDTKQDGRSKSKPGNKGDWYGVIRGAASVGVPGILIEHSFHTNTRSTEWLLKDGNLDNLAKAEAEVIAKYFGTGRITQNTSTSKQDGFSPYKVKVICDSLNIRKTPNFKRSDIVGAITNKGTYTIIGETVADGVTFGKLKSGKGWISLGEKYVKRLN